MELYFAFLAYFAVKKGFNCKVRKERKVFVIIMRFLFEIPNRKIL